MRSILLVAAAAAAAMLIVAGWGLNKAQSPDAAYGAATLGVIGACILLLCMLTFWFD